MRGPLCDELYWCLSLSGQVSGQRHCERTRKHAGAARRCCSKLQKLSHGRPPAVAPKPRSDRSPDDVSPSNSHLARLASCDLSLTTTEWNKAEHWRTHRRLAARRILCCIRQWVPVVMGDLSVSTGKLSLHVSAPNATARNREALPPNSESIQGDVVIPAIRTSRRVRD